MKSAADWSKRERAMEKPEDWWFIELEKMLIPGSVLDIGCGRARFADFLSKDHDYLGLDINCDVINSNKRAYPKLKFVCADVAKWDGWKKFDNIFSWVSLQHIPPPDIFEVFKKIKKYGRNLIFCEVTSLILSDYQWTHHYEDYFKLINKVPMFSGRSDILHFKGVK